jgi:phosphoribosylformylglycinamidine synthase
MNLWEGQTVSASLSDSLNKKLKHYRISTDEFVTISKLLGREPKGLEWALFSALWSEHCSYKSSRVHLKNLFNKSPRVVTSFGENAGVIDLGEGERVAFKMESHNHPSFIEPYQGAATGVGGILRDIFTMGARPIALANYLCFGEPKNTKTPHLVDGVVRGIAGYGNCVGVPNISGQTEFHKSYDQNNLVNAFALGLFSPGEKIVLSNAKGVGNKIVYVGAKTGKDGVHGASMASESFDENTEVKKPTIQKGDPFFEKLLIESCIEVMNSDLVVAIQDMGAAGLTSSCFEMAAKGGVGFDIHLDRVPVRDSSITPEEILLSESQERMLMIVEPKNLAALKKVFTHWDLDAEEIGEITDGNLVKLFWHRENICEIDPKILVDNAPKYNRPYNKWIAKNRVPKLVPLENSLTQNVTAKDPQLKLAGSSKNHLLLRLLCDMRGNARDWIYNQYDQRVGVKTIRDCSDSVGVVRLPAKDRALGIVLGCRPHIMRFDAYVGAADAVAYPALELSAKGFLPLAVTDCLNFGNPENKEIMSEFVATVDGLSQQCEALEAPIISGNVSFYNETLGVNITSTPATGVIGLRDKMLHIPQSHFGDINKAQAVVSGNNFENKGGLGDEIFLLRLPMLELQGFLSEVEDKKNEGVGDITPRAVALLAKITRELALEEYVHATRVVGKFGIAYALAKMCTPQLGAKVTLPNTSLFTERLYEIIFTVDKKSAAKFEQKFQTLKAQLDSANSGKLVLQSIGSVVSNELSINDEIKLSVTEILEKYNSPWEDSLAGIS